jgi:hypothetical protein
MRRDGARKFCVRPRRPATLASSDAALGDTFMQQDRLRQSLKHLGIAPSDHRVLKLLPLIYVAWADGKMELVEKERIHSFAARHFDLSAAAMAVLDDWLTKRPSHSYVTEALRDIYFLARAEDDGEIDFGELASLLSYAEGVARSTAEALDQPTSVSPAEERALEEIARELHIDHGKSWASLLAELR